MTQAATLDPFGTATLEDLLFVTMVADGSTPSEYLPLHGTRIGFPREIPVDPNAVTTFYGIPGRARQAGDGSWEWLMTTPVDLVAQFVDSIPGAPGWLDGQARTTWLNTTRYLLQQGIPVPTIQQGIPALYAAAVTNYRAQQDAPPPGS